MPTHIHTHTHIAIHYHIREYIKQKPKHGIDLVVVVLPTHYTSMCKVATNCQV